MQHVTTPKDLTTVLVKMDLMATAKTARVRFCLKALRQKSYRIEICCCCCFFALRCYHSVCFVVQFSSQSFWQFD